MGLVKFATGTIPSEFWNTNDTVPPNPLAEGSVTNGLFCEHSPLKEMMIVKQKLSG